MVKSSDKAFSIAEYDQQVAATDKLSPTAVKPVLLGLFGEIGSIMATSKKYHREGDAFSAYRDDVIEEFGDALWYLTALCRRYDMPLEEIIDDAFGGSGVATQIVASALPTAPVASIRSFDNLDEIDDLLLELAQQASALLNVPEGDGRRREQLVSFARAYLRAMQASKIPFGVIAERNLRKAQGRFLRTDHAQLPNFDCQFPEEERLPDCFEIEIKQRPNGRSYLRWQGVFIGDPLTDNIANSDGYRFHDVFHFAHAAVLHWSPTFRALIRHKRKSDPATDESQDSGRAIVIEEGLSAYVFSCAKDLNFFDGQSSISFDLLKAIQNFVRGYEVEQCPLSLWEDAILQGYAVFRLLKENNGGIVIGNRGKRTITYERLT